MEEMFGGLISYEDHGKLEDLAEKADKATALKMIELSIMYCQENGVYKLDESFLLYKMLNRLKE